MRRLVYSPKVNAYVKVMNGLGEPGPMIDISPYIVSGTVNRKVDQVSTAELVIRNTNFRWTPRGGSHPAVFHPMDPITIYLTRLKGNPIQVFTGYLDESPYVELFPGMVTLRASCTLKRLQYTYFNPALPFTWEFMAKYGWIPNPQTGSLINPKGYAGAKNDLLTDGSFGSLLYAMLKEQKLGGWDDSTIFIEKLPPGLVKSFAKTYKKITSQMDGGSSQSQKISDTITHIFTGLIGAGTIGASLSDIPGLSGAGAPGSAGFSGNPSSTCGQVQLLEKIANTYGVPYEVLYATVQGESSFNANVGCSGGLYCGWLQQGCPTPYAGVSGPCNPSDLGQSADLYARALKVKLASNPSYASSSQWCQWATCTQECATTVGGSGGCNGSCCYAGWDSYVAEAQAQKAKCGAAGAANNAATKGKGGSSGTKKGKPGGGGNATSVGLHQPLPAQYMVNPSPDQGVDYSAPCGTPLYAVTAGTVIYTNMSGFTDGGNTVPVLIGDDGNTYYYGHADGANQVNSGKGGRVSAGQQIGSVGNVGISTGCHLEIGIASCSGNTSGASCNPVCSGTSGCASAAALQSALGSGSALPSQGGTTTPGGGGSGDTTSGPVNPILPPWENLKFGQNYSRASAFSSTIEWATMEDYYEAVAITGERSLMNDKPLLPYIQEICKASMRSFQSSPRGDFFAFYPDYFGSYADAERLGNGPDSKVTGPSVQSVYWEIYDIEIIDGRIALTDDNLSTHVFVVGDTAYGGLQGDASSNLVNKLITQGDVNIFNAFEDNWVSTGKDSPLKDPAMATKFLQRYGLRVLYDPEPFIQSPWFEAFYAYQRFLYLWANHFLTPFQFSFMPELYPGGRVGLPDFNLRLYIQEVTHTFDYEAGFSTSATLSAPSLLDPNGQPNYGDIGAGMVMVGPLAQNSKTTTGKGLGQQKGKPGKPAAVGGSSQAHTPTKQ